MSDVNPKSILEALLFATDEPVPAKKLGEIVKLETLEVRRLLKEMRSEYDKAGRGFAIIEVAGGWQLLSREDFGEFVKKLHKTYAQAKLSQSALETLAVIAYKQPITGPEIAEIRGVNASGVVGTLLERQLVKVVGRKQVVGRPFLYATTREFLNRFGLGDLSELPKVEEMAEALGMEVPPLLAQPGPSTESLPFDSEPEVSEDPEPSPSEQVH